MTYRFPLATMACVLTAGLLAACAQPGPAAPSAQPNLKRFDQPDFEAYIKQNWTFAWAPDHAIPSHPTSVAQGEWTAVSGRFKGTFNKPMPLPDGSMVPPTGKAFDLEMVTLARWRDGCIAEERLFLNEAALMRLIGLAK